MCASCALLKKITGVKDVKVDLKHERVIVTFDPRKRIRLIFTMQF